MFQKPSNLKILREILSSHMELPEYFLGMHALFDGEVIFARDVVQVNLDLPPFPADFAKVWDWVRDQLRGSPEQETFVYQMGFGIDGEEDPAMDRLVELTRGSAMTIWTIDLAHQDMPTDGRRFLIVTVPGKKQAKIFRERYHGNDVFAQFP